MNLQALVTVCGCVKSPRMNACIFTAESPQIVIFHLLKVVFPTSYVMIPFVSEAVPSFLGSSTTYRLRLQPSSVAFAAFFILRYCHVSSASLHCRYLMLFLERWNKIPPSNF